MSLARRRIDGESKPTRNGQILNPFAHAAVPAGPYATVPQDITMMRTLLAALVPLALGDYSYSFTDAPTAAPTMNVRCPAGLHVISEQIVPLTSLFIRPCVNNNTMGTINGCGGVPQTFVITTTFDPPV